MSYELTPEKPGSKLQYDLFERFKSAETKIAIQKDGELTEISKYILQNILDIPVPEIDSSERRLIDVSNAGEYGFVYAKNKSICSLVGKGAVDMAIVGIDRVIEESAEKNLEIVDDYKDEYKWPLVLATPVDRGIDSFDQIKRIATQYPKISSRYFEQNSVCDVDIVSTAGSTEAFPYLDFEGPIDGIIDISISGRSLADNGLLRWQPELAEVYPVLIRSKD